MENIIMPKMFNYQKEIIENDSSSTIIGNMPRNGGKDYILACKVLYERPEICFYISMNNNQFRVLQEKFKEIFNMSPEIKDEISFFGEDRNKITIAYDNGDVSEIYNYNTLERGNKLLNTEVDMMLYSNCLPQFDIKAKKHISMVSISYSWLRNMYPCREVKVYNISLKQLIENNLTNKDWLDKHKKDDSKNFNQEFDLFNEYDVIFPKEERIMKKRNNQLDFNERIGYNFGIKELNKREYERLIKDNSDEIKKIFEPFKYVSVEIQDSIITICNNFGIIDRLSFCDVIKNIKEKPSELLLDFVANTYLKISYDLVK